MLKSCWDCLVGYDLMRNPTQAEEPYTTELNGLTRAPPWPQPQSRNGNMYILPTQIKSEDAITIDGDMQDNPRKLIVSLLTGSSSPDFDNSACHLEMDYSPENNSIAIKIISNGLQQVVNEDEPFYTSDFLTDSTFRIKFQISRGQYLNIFIGESYLYQISLKHNIEDIRFLSVSGDVNKVSGLNFQFG